MNLPESTASKIPRWTAFKRPRRAQKPPIRDAAGTIGTGNEKGRPEAALFTEFHLSPIRLKSDQA
jgi:hypothetical protein